MPVKCTRVWKKVGRKEVAWVSDGGKLKVTEQIKEIEQKVEEHMQDWKEKRGIDDDV